MKQTEKNRKISARREFYANLEKIRDLYNNKGFKFAKELYEHLNFNMSLWSFNHYFNKEIKNQNFHPTPQIENLNSKKNEIIENSSQNINQKEKEQCNEKDNISTVEDRQYSNETLERYRLMSEAMEKNEAVLQEANKIIKQHNKGKNNDNSGS